MKKVQLNNLSQDISSNVVSAQQDVTVFAHTNLLLVGKLWNFDFSVAASSTENISTVAAVMLNHNFLLIQKFRWKGEERSKEKGEDQGKRMGSRGLEEGIHLITEGVDKKGEEIAVPSY